MKEKNDNKQLRNKNIDRLFNIVLIGFSFYSFTNLTYSNISSAIKTKNVDKDLFNQNLLGNPYLLEIPDNTPLDVVIDENFSEKQKETIVEAISTLDDKLDGVNYNIILNAQAPDKQCISVLKDQTKTENYLGVTYAKYPLFATFIKYPINVSINVDYIEKEFKSKIAGIKTYDEYLGSIVKHEMLHTLGLRDLYDDASYGKSIMHGYTGTKSLNDPSQEELTVLNTVYPAKYKDTISKNNYSNFVTTTIGAPETHYFNDKTINQKQQKPENSNTEFEQEM